MPTPTSCSAADSGAGAPGHRLGRGGRSRSSHEGSPAVGACQARSRGRSGRVLVPGTNPCGRQRDVQDRLEPIEGVRGPRSSGRRARRPDAALDCASRGVAQPGRAPALGAGGRRFRSGHPDLVREQGSAEADPCRSDPRLRRGTSLKAPAVAVAPAFEGPWEPRVTVPACPACSLSPSSCFSSAPRRLRRLERRRFGLR
jgi:hypothetical protein